jgi:WD40 repeat protein
LCVGRNALKVWDLHTGEKLLTLYGHGATVRAIAVTPDSKQVISDASDGKLRVWDLATGTKLTSIQIHEGRVRGLAMMPDGKHLVSVAEDRSLKVWHMDTWQVVSSFASGNVLWCCAIAPDGSKIVAGEATGRIYWLPGVVAIG